MQICNRDFSRQDLEWIRRTVESRPDLSRYELSRLFCRQAAWRKVDGGLKDMNAGGECVRLEQNGLIRLPPPKRKPVCSRKIKPSVPGSLRPKFSFHASGSSLNLNRLHAKARLFITN